MILNAIKNREFLVSPLVISEFVFALSKLKKLEANEKNIEIFSNYASFMIDISLTKEAYKQCVLLNFCNNINDTIHLKYAEKYANKIVTFDKDFSKLKPHTNIEIEILQ